MRRSGLCLKGCGEWRVQAEKSKWLQAVQIDVKAPNRECCFANTRALVVKPAPWRE